MNETNSPTQAPCSSLNNAVQTPYAFLVLSSPSAYSTALHLGNSAPPNMQPLRSNEHLIVTSNGFATKLPPLPLGTAQAEQDASPRAFVPQPFVMPTAPTHGDDSQPQEQHLPIYFPAFYGLPPHYQPMIPRAPPPRFITSQAAQPPQPSSQPVEASSACLICLQPTPAVSAARGVHVRALLLCTCIRMMRERSETPVPDVRRRYAKSCRACRYWLELGIKKIEALTKGAGVNIQDLLAAQSRYWASQPLPLPQDQLEPVLGLYSPHPEDRRPRSLRKPLIDFVKKNVTQEMICDFERRLSKVAPARRVTIEEAPAPSSPNTEFTPHSVPTLPSHAEPRVTYDEDPSLGPHLPPLHDDAADDDDDSAATPRFFRI